MAMGSGKYDGVNPLDKLREGEPYFFVRAQDVLAPAAVEAYAALLEIAAVTASHAAFGGPSESLRRGAEDVRAFAERIRGWQSAHADLLKFPD